MAKTRRTRMSAENDHRRVTRPRLRTFVKETRGYPTGYLRAQSDAVKYDRESREVGYGFSIILDGLWLLLVVKRGDPEVTRHSFYDVRRRPALSRSVVLARGRVNSAVVSSFPWWPMCDVVPAFSKLVASHSACTRKGEMMAQFLSPAAQRKRDATPLARRVNAARGTGRGFVHVVLRDHVLEPRLGRLDEVDDARHLREDLGRSSGRSAVFFVLNRLHAQYGGEERHFFCNTPQPYINRACSMISVSSADVTESSSSSSIASSPAGSTSGSSSSTRKLSERRIEFALLSIVVIMRVIGTTTSWLIRCEKSDENESSSTMITSTKMMFSIASCDRPPSPVGGGGGRRPRRPRPFPFPSSSSVAVAAGGGGGSGAVDRRAEFVRQNARRS